MASVSIVIDKNRYGLKPIAVETKAHMLTLLCVGSLTCDGDTLSNIVFRIKHKPSGCLWTLLQPESIHSQLTKQMLFCSREN